MIPRISDTSPEAERAQIQILRAMPSWRKFRLVNDLIVTSRKHVLAGLRDRFPGASEQELRRRLATLCLGRELAEKVYGPEPDPPTWSMLPADFLEEIRAAVDTTILREKLDEYLKE
jgi:hypothetical protein